METSELKDANSRRHLKNRDLKENLAKVPGYGEKLIVKISTQFFVLFSPMIDGRFCVISVCKLLDFTDKKDLFDLKNPCFDFHRKFWLI